MSISKSTPTTPADAGTTYETRPLAELGIPAGTLAALAVAYGVWEVKPATVAGLDPHRSVVALCPDRHGAEVVAMLLQERHDLAHMDDDLDADQAGADQADDAPALAQTKAWFSHQPLPTLAAGTLARRTAQVFALFGEMVGIREMAGRAADYLKAMPADYLLTLIHDKAAAAVAAHMADSRAEVDELGPEPAAGGMQGGDPDQVDAPEVPFGDAPGDDMIATHREMKRRGAVMHSLYDAGDDDQAGGEA